MKKITCIILALLALALCACGETAAPAAPAPAAEETAEPTPSPVTKILLPHGIEANPSAESLDLSALTNGELEQAAELLPQLTKLKEVRLGKDSGAETLLPGLTENNPDVRFDYSFELNGTETDFYAEELDLSGMEGEELEAAVKIASGMKNVSRIFLGDERNCAYTVEQLTAIHNACPNAVLDYTFKLYEQRINLRNEEINFRYVKIEDDAEYLRQLIPCMTALTDVRLEYCGVEDETMAAVRDQFPDVNIVWRVWFGGRYSVMTDTEMILASCPDLAGDLTGENTQTLKYCTKVKYLDIGHNNKLRTLDFIRYMPDLEVGIFALSDIEDWSALADCPKLEYLELFTSRLHDLTPLSGLKNLRHLNICYNFALNDITPLYSLTELERLWIGRYDPVPPEQIEEMQRRAPNCRINTTTEDPTEEYWRYEGVDGLGNPKYHPRYALLRQQFHGYDMDDYSIDPAHLFMMRKPY